MTCSGLDSYLARASYSVANYRSSGARPHCVDSAGCTPLLFPVLTAAPLRVQAAQHIGEHETYRQRGDRNGAVDSDLDELTGDLVCCQGAPFPPWFECVKNRMWFECNLHRLVLQLRPLGPKPPTAGAPASTPQQLPYTPLPPTHTHSVIFLPFLCRTSSKQPLRRAEAASAVRRARPVQRTAADCIVHGWTRRLALRRLRQRLRR